jgi:hypothetical protein
MLAHTRSTPDHADAVSPLLLSDRLISLAEAADEAGYTAAAEQLVTLAYAMLDERPHLPH